MDTDQLDDIELVIFDDPEDLLSRSIWESIEEIDELLAAGLPVTQKVATKRLSMVLLQLADLLERITSAYTPETDLDAD